MFVHCSSRVKNMQCLFSFHVIRLAVPCTCLHSYKCCHRVFRERNILRCVKATVRCNVHTPSFSTTHGPFYWEFQFRTCLPDGHRDLYFSCTCTTVLPKSLCFRRSSFRYLVEPGYGKAITTLD
jgi:hypothetical protein